MASNKNQKPKVVAPVNPEWTEAAFASAKSAVDFLPEIFGKNVATKMLKARGRPRAQFPKERINIRLSHDVLEHFKHGGVGWQTRIDHALQQFIKEHPNTR